MMQLVLVKNDSLQTLEVYFKHPYGVKSYIMSPNETKVISKDMVSDHILKMQRRRLIKVSNYN